MVSCSHLVEAFPLDYQNDTFLLVKFCLFVMAADMNGELFKVITTTMVRLHD